MMSALQFCLEFVGRLLRVQNIWRYKKVVGYEKSTFWELFQEDFSTM
jgi:hypothetical protein